jgi:hypothetical protein
MNFLARLHARLDNLGKYIPVAIAVAGGLGSIAMGNIPGAVLSFLHAVTLIAAGATVVGLHMAVADVPKNVLRAATAHPEI